MHPTTAGISLAIIGSADPSLGRVLGLQSVTLSVFYHCRYPFQGKHMTGHGLREKSKLYSTAQHNLLGHKMATNTHTWQKLMEARTDPSVFDHKIQGASIFPGAGYLEMALAAVQELDGVTSTGELATVKAGNRKPEEENAKDVEQNNRSSISGDMVQHHLSSNEHGF